MSNKLKMATSKSIEVLLQQGWSQRKISRELGINRETVARYVRLARSKPAISTAGDLASVADDIDGRSAVDAATKSPASSTEPATKSRAGRKSSCSHMAREIESRVEAGLSAQRIFQDLVSELGFHGSYESVKRFVRRLGLSTPLPFRRMECGPGEEAQVDFGQGAWTLAPDSKRRARPHLFRLVLSCSRKGYSEVVSRQTTEDFIRCLENAFWSLGGVPRILVVDNLKAAVLKADWFDPTINPKMEAFASHYGFIVRPAKPYMPRHKGKVEAGIKYVQENAVKGKEFKSLVEQNTYLFDWESKVADQRIHGTTRQQVRQIFEDVERPALLPLPVERFPFYKEAERIVHRDGHINVDRSYYSVPPEFYRQTVWVRWDSRTVRIFDQRHQQIAMHTKTVPGLFSTNRNHLASEKISGVERGAAYLIRLARLIGIESTRWAEAMLEARGVQGVRVLQGFLALAAKHSCREMERVSGIAASHGAFRLKSLRHLLENSDAEGKQLTFMDSHPIIRNPSEYGQFVHDAFQSTLDP